MRADGKHFSKSKLSTGLAALAIGMTVFGTLFGFLPNDVDRLNRIPDNLISSALEGKLPSVLFLGGLVSIGLIYWWSNARKHCS